MHLLENARNLLLNTTTTLFAAPAPVAALAELPPPVVDEFWKLVEAAIRVVERAREDELLTSQGEAKNLERFCDLLTRALRLYRDALRRAALSAGELRDELDSRRADPVLQELLLQTYFRQVRGLIARITEYGQALLDASDKHPVAVMDINVLLDAVERFTGYVRNSTGAVAGGNADLGYLLRAIAGTPGSWFDTSNGYSEFSMFSCRDREETEKYLSFVWSGACNAEIADLRQWQHQAWDGKVNQKLKRPPDASQFPAIEEDREGREIWFYINGVVTDHWISQLNAEHLAYLFKRPVHILHNPTEGLHRDIRECISGRVLDDKTGVAQDLRREFAEMAGDKGRARIVLIAHSQGTILASEMIKELHRRRSPLLKRMEVFNFAFCADEFPGDCCRHVEHYVNGNDLVAALSVVPANSYHVPGPVFLRRNQWGHFLGAHYLDPEGFPAGAYRDETGEHRPLLANYLDGASYGV